MSAKTFTGISDIIESLEKLWKRGDLQRLSIPVKGEKQLDSPLHKIVYARS